MQIEEIRGNSQGEVQAHHLNMAIYCSLHEFFTRCTWIFVLKYYLFMGSIFQYILYLISFLHDLNRRWFGFCGSFSLFYLWISSNMMDNIYYIFQTTVLFKYLLDLIYCV